MRLHSRRLIFRIKLIHNGGWKEGTFMLKGYYTDNGYLGLVDNEYMLFESDTAYYEYVEANANV